MPKPARSNAGAPVTVGVDTYLDLHGATNLYRLGRPFGELTVPTREADYAELLGWAGTLCSPERIGIEGAGFFGAGPACFLRARGTEVLEVGRSKRRDEHRSGKSDPIDAASGSSGGTGKRHRLGQNPRPEARRFSGTSGASVGVAVRLQ